MDYYVVLLPLGIILVVSKLLSKFCRKVNLPQVIGMLLAGVLIGVLNYIPTVGEFVLSPTAVTGLGFFAKIGVILIMFAAGLDIDIKQIRVIGVPAILITMAGVAVPMVLGTGRADPCLFPELRCDVRHRQGSHGYLQQTFLEGIAILSI